MSFRRLSLAQLRRTVLAVTMKFGVRSSAAVLAVGAVVAVAVAIVGYAVVPGIIDETILQVTTVACTI